ncbi:MAG: Fe-S cluster assembly ATPase SufC [Elusimicrobia bacterium RIFCSPLOWO2_01_FULL_54_10]|nr:MAG: Fe-S cluster assembly ATPase SufC [Elusimicrobia bacterium RIFCSPLOWO2_01_FULL_54_10]
MTPLLQVKDLHVEVEGKQILNGVNLEIKPGEIHALMGPNGSGKSTLSNALMGHPKYIVTKGTIHYQGEDITGLSADQRARKGMFLAFQYPTAIPGVSVTNFLRTVLKAVRGAEVAVKDFRKELKEKMELLEMRDSFAGRYVNDGFSGGEKKRLEILQMALMKPKLALLDETDSGLDIDALQVVSEGINRLRGPDIGMLVITHYQRLLNYVQPDVVHVLVAGRIAQSGGKELALELESKGYEWIEERQKAGAPA